MIAYSKPILIKCANLIIETVVCVNNIGCKVYAASHYNRYISDIKLENINSLHLKKIDAKSREFASDIY